MVQLSNQGKFLFGAVLLPGRPLAGGEAVMAACGSPLGHKNVQPPNLGCRAAGP